MLTFTLLVLALCLSPGRTIKAPDEDEERFWAGSSAHTNMTWTDRLDNEVLLNKYRTGIPLVAIETVSIGQGRVVMMGSGRMPMKNVILSLGDYNRKRDSGIKYLKLIIPSIQLHEAVLNTLAEPGVGVPGAKNGKAFLYLYYEAFRGPGEGRPMLQMDNFKEVIQKFPPRIILSVGFADGPRKAYGYTKEFVEEFKNDWARHGFLETHEPQLKVIVEVVIKIAHISATSEYAMNKFREALKERKVRHFEMRLADDEMDRVDMDRVKLFLKLLNLNLVTFNVPRQFREMYFTRGPGDVDENGQPGLLVSNCLVVVGILLYFWWH